MGSLRALCAALLATALLAFTSTPASASCDGTLHGPCRGVEQLTSAAANTVAPPGIAGFEGSWVDRALDLQYRLAGDVPLRDAPWVGTHNSFNAVKEMGPTLSDLDANQQLTLVDQLRIDVRSLELDVHWFPSLEAGGASAPVVCHARPSNELNAGCSIEKTFGRVLGEIGGWLAENPREVLLLYVEDQLDSGSGYAAAAAAVEARLGRLLYRPPSGGAACDKLPLDLTRDEVLAARKQVVLVSGCGIGPAWKAVAFDWSDHEETRPRGYTDFPACGTDFDRSVYDSTLVRYFEDSTALTATLSTVGAASSDDGITPATAAAMTRCGVDLVGMDQLLPDDGRLEALVWSWARDEPSAAGDCAIQRADGRWVARDCAELRPPACRAADGSWSVPAVTVPATEAAAACASAQHSVPRTGYEGQLLRVAMEQAGVGEVWLAYRRDGGGWTALDTR